MKNLLIAVILFVVFVPFTAGAFTVPEEVQVTTPPTAVAEAAPAPAPTPANNKTYKAVKSLDRKLVGKKGIVVLIRDKVNGLVASIAGAKTSADNATTAANAAKKSADNAKNAVTALDAKLTDKKTGEFKKLNDTAWSVGNELSKDMVKYFALTVALFIGLGVLIFFRTGQTNKLVEDSSKKTADLVNTLDPSPIEFDVAGKHIVFQSPVDGIKEGYYLKIHVPANMTGDPATYERKAETKKGIVRRETEKTMEKYFAGTFDAPEWKLQKDLIEYLKGTGELAW